MFFLPQRRAGAFNSRVAIKYTSETACRGELANGESSVWGTPLSSTLWTPIRLRSASISSSPVEFPPPQFEEPSPATCRQFTRSLYPLTSQSESVQKMEQDVGIP